VTPLMELRGQLTLLLMLWEQLRGRPRQTAAAALQVQPLAAPMKLT
jgi:hypothetical protein